MSVNGNSSFTKVQDSLLSGSNLQNGVLDVLGGGGSNRAVTNSGAASVNLTDDEWKMAAFKPVVITGSSTGDITLTAGEADSAGAAAAASLQQALGLSNVGDSAFLRIVKNGSQLHAINIRANSDLEILAATGVAVPVTVAVTASNVTSGTEACTAVSITS